MSAMSKDQTLVSGEEAVVIVHPHWKVMIRPAALAVLIVAVVLVAIVMIPFGKAAPAAALVLGAIAIVGVMWSLMIPLLRWWTTTYELTSRRLRVRTGVMARRGKDIPLSRVSDVSYEAGILDRLLGSGTLVVESPGEHGQERLTQLPRVVYLQSLLFQLIEEERQRIAHPEQDED
jgi:uncharacterized membrane protein YdbT with pleckstrin-like domain